MALAGRCVRHAPKRSAAAQRLAAPQRGRRVVMRIVNLADPVVMVGDIGGTNARLAVWKISNNQELFSKTYPTAAYATFEDVMDAFSREPVVAAAPPKSAALAIAGAVRDNVCSMTNLSWVIDGGALALRFGFQVALLNDFEAVGYGIPMLQPEDFIALNDVPVNPKAPKVVMGPGTGLGAAHLFWDSGIDDYLVWPGEGGHASFAPRGWKQRALLEYVEDKYGHCEIEQVACGAGLALIYEFLLTDEIANRPHLLTTPRQLTPPEISMAACAGSDQIAVEAVDMFLAIVGAEAGAMALRCLATGGVYIAGGVAAKLVSRVKEGGLLESYLMKNGRPKFNQLLQANPLFLVTNEKVGQLGAAQYARRLLMQPVFDDMQEFATKERKERERYIQEHFLEEHGP